MSTSAAPPQNPAAPPSPPDPPELARAKLAAAISKEEADTAANRAKRLQTILPSQVKAPEGTTKVEGDPIECQILAYKQMKKLAAAIGTAVASVTPPPTKIVIYSESEINLILGLEAFTTQLTIAKTRLQLEVEHAKKVIASIKSGPSRAGVVAASMALVAAGGAIRAAADFISLFNIDETVKYKDLTILDISLAAAVARALQGKISIYHPSIVPPHLLGSKSGIRHDLSVLAILRNDLDEVLNDVARLQTGLKRKIDRLVAKIAKDQEAGKPPNAADAAERDRLQADYDRLAAVAARIQASATSYDAFTAALLKADETTGLSGLSRVLRAEKLKALDASHWLLLKMAGAGGGYKTRRWLWWPTTKLYYSGGAIAQFMLFDREGKIVKADVLPKYSGFIRVTDREDVTVDLSQDY